MSEKKNYNKMSTKPKEAEVSKPQVVDVATEVEKEPAKVKTMYGAVFNCERLNVRSEPNLFAKPVGVIEKGTKVKIDENNSTDSFYAVTVTVSKNEKISGYCMKTYITIK